MKLRLRNTGSDSGCIAASMVILASRGSGHRGLTESDEVLADGQKRTISMDLQPAHGSVQLTWLDESTSGIIPVSAAQTPSSLGQAMQPQTGQPSQKSQPS